MRICLCLMIVLGLSAVEKPISVADLMESHEFLAAKQSAMVSHKELPEVSGMVCSRQNADMLWMVNDSGNGPDLYGINAAGELRAHVRLKGVANRDWEAMASYEHNNQQYLIIADCGDNAGIYPMCALYVVKEPDLLEIDGLNKSVKVQNVKVERIIRYKYSDGARDCEAVFVDEVEEKIYFISKRDVPARVYSLGLHVDDKALQTAQFVCELSAFPRPTATDLEEDPKYGKNRTQITGASLSVNNEHLFVSTYQYLYHFPKYHGDWKKAFQHKPIVIKRPRVNQNEALSIAEDDTIWFSSEQLPWPLYRVDAEQKP